MLPDFQDTQLLRRALTHTSFANELAQDKAAQQRELAPDKSLSSWGLVEDNERLEFLGDAVLDFVAAAWLFERFPDFDEGRLTSLRSAMVRSTTLAQLAEQIGLPDLLQLGRGEIEMGGRKSANILSDAFEALVGALYLDQGIAAVRAYVQPLFEQLTPVILADNLDRDPKSQLQEWSQDALGVTPRYRLIASSGPAHQRVFSVEAWLGETLAASGSGPSKQAAEQAAARATLQILDQISAAAAPKAAQCDI